MDRAISDRNKYLVLRHILYAHELCESLLKSDKSNKYLTRLEGWLDLAGLMDEFDYKATPLDFTFADVVHQLLLDGKIESNATKHPILIRLTDYDYFYYLESIQEIKF